MKGIFHLHPLLAAGDILCPLINITEENFGCTTVSSVAFAAFGADKLLVSKVSGQLGELVGKAEGWVDGLVEGPESVAPP